MLFNNVSNSDLFFVVTALLALGLYSWAVYKTNRISRLRIWPVYRIVNWFGGVLLAVVTVIEPFATLSHDSFIWHMVGHLLLGMLSPLLLALSAPVTLLLRTLKVNTARKISKLLKSRLAAFYSNPIVASTLNIGSLWVLYTTDLFAAMHHHQLLYMIIHVHIFAAGYVFTISMIYIDPVSSRHSFRFRTIVFIIALAGHGILSKYLYAYPPEGVDVDQAKLGAMLMYYGGDAVDLMIIVILFHQWYRSIPRKYYDGHGATHH